MIYVCIVLASAVVSTSLCAVFYHLGYNHGEEDTLRIIK